DGRPPPRCSPLLSISHLRPPPPARHMPRESLPKIAQWEKYAEALPDSARYRFRPLALRGAGILERGGDRVGDGLGAPRGPRCLERGRVQPRAHGGHQALVLRLVAGG